MNLHCHLLCRLLLCRASVKLSTCTSEEILLKRQRGLRLPTTLCVKTLWRVCCVPPPPCLSVSCLHSGVTCRAVTPPRSLPLVNTTLVLSFYTACEKLKPEAGVLGSYLAYLRHHGRCAKAGCPSSTKGLVCAHKNKKKSSL